MKGKSLEELVCSPTSDGELAEFRRHTSLSLNMVLQPLFEAGWDPKKCGKHRLEEAAVVWLKGLDSLPAAEAHRCLCLFLFWVCFYYLSFWSLFFLHKACNKGPGGSTTCGDESAGCLLEA